MRRALVASEAGDAARLPLPALRAYAADHPRSYPVQMTLGFALRKQGELDDALQVFERAAALVPLARGKDSPHAQMAEIALEKKDRGRAISELQAVVATDFDNVDAARQLA